MTSGKKRFGWRLAVITAMALSWLLLWPSSNEESDCNPEGRVVTAQCKEDFYKRANSGEPYAMLWLAEVLFSERQQGNSDYQQWIFKAIEAEPSNHRALTDALAYCGGDAKFDRKRLLNALEKSLVLDKNTDYLLIEFLVSPFCAKELQNFELATKYVQAMSQCRSMTIVEYLLRATEKSFVIPDETRKMLMAHTKYCSQENVKFVGSRFDASDEKRIIELLKRNSL